jgi:hypothetical protein
MQHVGARSVARSVARRGDDDARVSLPENMTVVKSSVKARKNREAAIQAIYWKSLHFRVSRG